ncbi:MAG: hypothetical protein ABIV25_13185 [Paracoccaceae bacterium]
MTRKRLQRPPATPRNQRLQKAIIGTLVARSVLAYMGFAVVLALAGRPTIRAVETGSLVMIGVMVLGLIAVYAIAGGLLCAAFIGQLRDWPPPGPSCRFNGAHFARTWPWTAPKILTDLFGGHLVGGES